MQDAAQAGVDERFGFCPHGSAATYSDEMGPLLADSDHSLDDERDLLLAVSERIRILVVSHAVWAEGDEIRIISARRATRVERQQYVERIRR